MTTIGIYDSGVGGLTVLKRLLNIKAPLKFLYLADNKHHPFGLLAENELKDIVSNGLNQLNEQCDIVVAACNTASSVIDNGDILRLTPPGAAFKTDKKFSDKNGKSAIYDKSHAVGEIENMTHSGIEYAKPLLLATTGTAARILNWDDFNFADTGELATLIENELQKNFETYSNELIACENAGRLDMSVLQKYIADRLGKFKGVKKVILGCSHYPFAINEIRQTLGEVQFVDGGDAIVQNVKKRLTEFKNSNGENDNPEHKIEFVFSGKDESEKYRFILNAMMKHK